MDVEQAFGARGARHTRSSNTTTDEAARVSLASSEQKRVPESRRPTRLRSTSSYGESNRLSIASAGTRKSKLSSLTHKRRQGPLRLEMERSSLSINSTAPAPTLLQAPSPREDTRKKKKGWGIGSLWKPKKKLDVFELAQQQAAGGLPQSLSLSNGSKSMASSQHSRVAHAASDTLPLSAHDAKRGFDTELRKRRTAIPPLKLELGEDASAPLSRSTHRSRRNTVSADGEEQRTPAPKKILVSRDRMSSHDSGARRASDVRRFSDDRQDSDERLSNDVFARSGDVLRGDDLFGTDESPGDYGTVDQRTNEPDDASQYDDAYLKAQIDALPGLQKPRKKKKKSVLGKIGKVIWGGSTKHKSPTFGAIPEDCSVDHSYDFNLGTTEPSAPEGEEEDDDDDDPDPAFGGRSSLTHLDQGRSDQSFGPSRSQERFREESSVRILDPVDSKEYPTRMIEPSMSSTTGLAGPSFNLSQPVTAPPQRSKSSSWFGSKKKDEERKRRKRIEYLQQARAEVEAAERYGLDSNMDLLTDRELVAAEEKRKLKALLLDTREGYMELINEFSKAVYAKHGRNCMWRLSVLESKSRINGKPDLQLLDDCIQQTLQSVRESDKEDIEGLRKALSVYEALAKGEPTQIHWKALCLEDAAALAKIQMLRSQLESFANTLFAEEEEVRAVAHVASGLQIEGNTLLNGTESTAATTAAYLDDRWTAQRDLPNLRNYVTLKDTKNFVAKMDDVMELVLRSTSNNALEQCSKLTHEIEAYYASMTSRISQVFQSIVSNDMAALSIPLFVRQVMKLHDAGQPLPQFNAPTHLRGAWDENDGGNTPAGILKSAVAHFERQYGTVKYGSGFAIDLGERDLGQLGFGQVDKWLHDALYWQGVDLANLRAVRNTGDALAHAAHRKESYVISSLEEKLSILWADQMQQVQQEALERAEERVGELTLLGSVMEVNPLSESRAMAQEDFAGRLQLAWASELKDKTAKTGEYKVKFKTSEEVFAMRDTLSEFARVLDCDATLLEDMKVQVVVDAVSEELKNQNAKLTALRKRRQEQESSLQKQLKDKEKAKTTVEAELLAEEDKLAKLEEAQRTHSEIAEEVAELKEKLEQTKLAVKGAKAAQKELREKGQKFYKDRAEVEYLAKAVEKQNKKLAEAQSGSNHKTSFWQFSKKKERKPEESTGAPGLEDDNTEPALTSKKPSSESSGDEQHPEKLVLTPITPQPAPSPLALAAETLTTPTTPSLGPPPTVPSISLSGTIISPFAGADARLSTRRSYSDPQELERNSIPSFTVAKQAPASATTPRSEYHLKSERSELDDKALMSGERSLLPLPSGVPSMSSDDKSKKRKHSKKKGWLSRLRLNPSQLHHGRSRRSSLPAPTVVIEQRGGLTRKDDDANQTTLGDASTSVGRSNKRSLSGGQSNSSQASSKGPKTTEDDLTEPLSVIHSGMPTTSDSEKHEDTASCSSQGSKLAVLRMSAAASTPNLMTMVKTGSQESESPPMDLNVHSYHPFLASPLAEGHLTPTFPNVPRTTTFALPATSESDQQSVEPPGSTPVDGWLNEGYTSSTSPLSSPLNSCATSPPLLPLVREMSSKEYSSKAASSMEYGQRDFHSEAPRRLASDLPSRRTSDGTTTESMLASLEDRRHPLLLSDDSDLPSTPVKKATSD